MAVVLIALTLWLVWRPSSESARPEAGEQSDMRPMGDEFEDQYTSATADLSAGGVAITTAQAIDEELELAPEANVETSSPSRWPEATIGPEGSTSGLEDVRPGAPTPTTPTYGTPVERHPVAMRTGLPTAGPEQSGLARATPRTIGMGAAAALTLAGAVAGAWLYARWQRERNKPLSRLRRRFR